MDGSVLWVHNLKLSDKTLQNIEKREIRELRMSQV
jgi:heme exporter protein D